VVPEQDLDTEHDTLAGEARRARVRFDSCLRVARPVSARK
jgi:hypothetical protein